MSIKRFFKYQNLIRFVNPGKSWITYWGIFLESIAAIVQIHDPEPGSLELNVLHPQVQSHVVGLVDHRGEHLNVEGQLVGLVKGVLVVLVGQHAVKDGLHQPVEAVD